MWGIEQGAREWRKRMNMTGKGEKVHNVPVPERHLPLVYQVLAEAYGAEAAVNTGAPDIRKEPPIYGGSRGWIDDDPELWTEDEVTRLYHESTPRQRDALDYLADRADDDEWVKARELARAVYPDNDPDEAEGRLYGVLGSFGRRSAGYGKTAWFFYSKRERLADGSLGYFEYKMLPKQAAWVLKASGRPDPE
jgi:hypothetical protein